MKIIDELTLKSSYGMDRLSNKLLTYIKHDIAPLPSVIINLSITTGIFPDSLKIAKVIPTHKKILCKCFRKLSSLFLY